MTKAELLQCIISGLPYGNQCVDFDLDSEKDAIRFTWRGNRLRVSTSCHTNEVGDGVLSGSDIAILAEALITAHWMQMPSKM